VTEREQIIENIVSAMQVVSDDLRLPMSIWTALAEAALSEIETPPSTHYSVKRCTCTNNGYSKVHLLGCELYAAD
jgi:hypothetical protein